MNVMDYDVLILGGGIIGCAAAYELSKYSLNIALIEKDYDIADDVALINAAIVYDGSECEDSLMSKLESMGNSILYETALKFNVPHKKCGTLIVAANSDQEVKLRSVYERSIKRGIQNISLLGSKDVYEMEPNLNISVRSAIYTKNTGVVCPYDLALAYGEIAFENGVKFKLEEEVIDIQKISKGFRVITNKNKFTCNMVLNTTPGENYSIDTVDRTYRNRSNLKYFLLDKSYKGSFKNILSTFQGSGERMYTVPVVHGNTIVAVGTNEDISYEEALNRVSKLIGNLDNEKIISYYESSFYNDTILIDDSLIDKGYIKVTGKHYGQVTMTPYIARMVCETIISNINCVLKKDFIDRRQEVYRFRDLSNEERSRIIEMDNKYGRIICSCQLVTEGEIIDSIRRPLGARTIEGIKRRTGASFGSCQGSNCINKLVGILARETNKKFTEIVKDSKNSNMLKGRIKEFEEV
jgi:L-2-hydroxyglutarate oxidase LhgO